MSTSDSWKLLVFRDGKRVCSGTSLLRQLQLQTERVLSLSDFATSCAQEELIEALLRAGELECAVADAAADDNSAETLASLTDELAIALIARRRPQLSSEILSALASLPTPQQLTLSPPEGFCYYALHPLDYADLLSDQNTDAPNVAVLGIRSIGTTLSAIVAAHFKRCGITAERITVRPAGHPFDRSLSFTSKQLVWIGEHTSRSAQFFVVDEGPGLSGSSFLAVANALEAAGVPRHAITLLPSSVPDVDKLIAPNAAARWSRYRTLPLKPTRRIPPGAAEDVSGGAWRTRVFASEVDWPAVWPWTERKKYTSADGRRLFRFIGHGHYGKAELGRSEMLAEHQWGPAISSADDGFGECEWLHGARGFTADRDTVIDLARYCAFRAEYFAHEPEPQEALEDMARINLERALGISVPIELPVERAVLADARMMPHEWLRLPDRRLQKFDAVSHGDDHFYPGPTDIAWDLAGAIVEWDLNLESRNLLLSQYQRLTHDPLENRLAHYLIAYSVFRLAYCVSAGNSAADSCEAARFQRQASHYRKSLGDFVTAHADKKFAGLVAAGK